METQTQATQAHLNRFERTKQKADRLLALNKITPKDLDGFDQPEREYLNEKLTQVLSGLTGTQGDEFSEKVELITQPYFKRDLWEYNHTAITSAIAGYMQQYGAMPAINFLAEKTGLSRQTVAKHVREYKKHPAFLAQMEQFQFMAPKVLAKVFKGALNGDIKAARLYFEMIGAMPKLANITTLNARQNNYIQINNTVLSQENLKHLSADQLNQIENIISCKDKTRVL